MNFLFAEYLKDMEYLSQVAESDDSETEEKLELQSYFLEAVKKDSKTKPIIDTNTR